ncbi:heparinase II/III family protein [Paenibacillus sp. GYB004]|uniref:carboxypeptidase regulatory-like domain-containing protein n=1 Tax=Paenibacillus sp. GYB004 TaxID=2994393 RepID=UPI002F96DBEB
MHANTNKLIVLPEWSQAPALDGELNDAAWNDAATLDDFRTAYSYEPASGDIAYKMAYDDTNLYIGGTVSLEEIQSLSRVEIVLSPGSSGTLHYVAGIPIQPNRALTTEWYRTIHMPETPQRIDLTSFASETFADAGAGTFSLEAAIPFSSFGPPSVSVGDEWRINIIHIHNFNTKPMSSWIPIRNSRFMDRSGDTIAYSANVVDQGRLGSVFFKKAPQGDLWKPDGWELNFTDFAQKRLTFAQPVSPRNDFVLEWKEPNADWQLLNELDAMVNSSLVSLTFEHPEPLRDGMYQLRLTASSGNPNDNLLAIFTFDREQLIEAGTAALDYTIPTGGGPTEVTYAPASAEVEAVMTLIPDQPGFRYVGLPEMPQLTPDGQYTLSADGQRIISKRTGMSYPSGAYPETNSLTVIGRNGTAVNYPYYEDGQGKRYFLSAHLWYLQRQSALTKTETISRRDPLGAARLLYRFAQAYDTYMPTTDEAWYTIPMNITSGPPYNYWGGMWERWNLNDLSNLRPLLQAYNRVKQTDALQVLGAEIGIDVEKKLIEDMFLPSMDYVFSFPITLGNMDASTWQGLIEAGRALGQPEYIHKAVEWMNDYAGQRFLSDGSWYEVTTSYHDQAISGLISAINLLQGYSDPVGYVSPRTGRRFDNLDLYSEFPILEKARQFSKNLAYPNGKAVPIQDTWASGSVAQPIPEAGPLLLPSAGIGRLTSDENADQTQLYMQFTPKYGHNHYDPLSLNVFAEGQELLPDLGYTHSKYRYFTVSTIGHNTVVVNSRNMTIDSESKHGGRIEQFAQADSGSFQVMRAEEKRAYPETTEYSREPWLISFPDDSGKGYVLDLFRVSGGDRHEYTLQGDANVDSYFRTDMTLADYGPRLLPPGVEASEATDQGDSGSAEGHYPGYIYIKDVKQAVLSGDKYNVTLDTYDGIGEKAKLNVIGLLESGSNELYLGRSPSIRSTRLNGSSKDDNVDVSLHDMPKLVLRRDGNDVTSTFVTLLEPYGATATTRVEAVDRLVPDQSPAGAVIIQIAYGNTTDIVLSNPRHPGGLLTVGDIAMRGELGFIRLVDGALTEMQLTGGTSLKKGNVEITGQGIVTGTITGTKRSVSGDTYDALVTETEVGNDVVGSYVIVTHPDESTRGFKVSDTRQVGGKTEIVLADQDPGFEIREDGSSRQNYYPAKEWTGLHTFRIAGTAAYDGEPVPDTGPTGNVTGTVYDPYGAPLSGAAVNVSGYASIATHTDPNGQFILSNVPKGVRHVKAKKAEYAQGVSDAVYVQAGQTMSVSIVLPKELPPVLSEVTEIAGAGDPVRATSSKDGNMYLVPAGTLPNPANIETIAATVGTAVYGIAAGIPVLLDTTGLSPGRYHVFSIDAHDGVSSSASIQLIPIDKSILEDGDEDIVYTGAWTQYSNSAYSGGTVKRAGTAGSQARVSFYGSKAKVIGTTSTSNGYADIFVDGVFQTKIDTYSSSTRYQQVLYETDTLAEGVHTIVIEATGEKRSAAANAYVTLDAVQILHEDELPYQLTGITNGPLIAGQTVAATSPRDGALYLVPSATEATKPAIEAGAASSNGRSAVVTANVYGMLDTTGLATDRYRVYAIDTMGYVSEGSSGISILDPAMVSVDDDEAIVAYTGDWKSFDNTAYWGGTVRRAQSAGSYADIPFYGTKAVLLGSRSFNNGKAHIYIDGVYQTTIDTYNPTVQYQQELFVSDSLEEGLHMIRVEAAWTRNPASSNYYVSIDALQLNVAD